MKQIINLLALAATLAIFTAPAYSQAKECSEEFKTTTYKKWYDNRKDHQDIAFQASEEWIATCPTDDGPYGVALKKFNAAYKAATGADATKKQFEDAYLKKNYAEQIRLGKQVIANEPDNTAAFIIMGLAGLGDPAQLNEATQYAKKAIEMLNAGKPFLPLASKDQALAYLNNVLGKAALKTTPADAIPYFLKAARLESELKKNPQLYADIAGAYGEGYIVKLSDDYHTKFTTETPESKLALENLNQYIDRQIDAFARATALTTNPEGKKALMEVLTGLYKDRHNKSDAGLSDMLGNILNTTIPDPPTLLTLPTPAATPASAATPAATPASAATPGAAAPSVPTATPKPTPTPTPAKKPRT
ncbi:MAG: hypothetical protein ABJC10_14465 [Acidobacteriota bacterium]